MAIEIQATDIPILVIKTIPAPAGAGVVVLAPIQKAHTEEAPAEVALVIRDIVIILHGVNN